MTLSNKRKILKTANKYFKNVKLLIPKDWPLPKSMYSKKIIREIKEERFNQLQKTKYGLILYSQNRPKKR